MQQLIEMENTMSKMTVITKLLEQEVKGIRSDVNYLKTENKDLQIEIRTIKSETTSTNDLAQLALEKVTLRNASEFGGDWLTQKDLGLMFEPNLSSHQVGNLLRSTSFAMKKKSKTTPTQCSISRGYVRRNVKENYTSWCWYAPTVKKNVIKFLQKKNVYDKFLKTTNIDELKELLITI